MRLLHTSDWHLGRRLHGQELIEAQAHFLDWLVRVAVDEQVDAVLVSGDVYDRAQPGPDAVRLMDRTLAAFVSARVPLILASGNHDSAVRLQYAGQVLEAAGIHLRTDLSQATEPVLLGRAPDLVGVYAIPYLLPDAAAPVLEVERSHAAVLGEVMTRIRNDAAVRGLAQVVVMAHAFVTGATGSESERDIRVGGIGDAPASVFDGVAYVALGHLHGPQRVPIPGSATVVEYSGSPLAFSFSERDHTKSVTLVDLPPDGPVESRRLPAPVPRPLRQVSGRLDDLLGGSLAHDPEMSEAWVKVVLTDPGRVADPMERLRRCWPGTLVLEFAPERDGQVPALVRLSESTDPVEVCAGFVAVVSGAPASAAAHEVLDAAVRSVRSAQAGA